MSRKNEEKEFRRLKFQELYQEKWINKGKTAVKFAEEICKLMPGSRCDEKYVYDWKTGRQTPVKYLAAICQVLEVDISEFTPYKHDDRYRYSQELANGLNEALQKIAVEKFHISLAFLQGMREIIPDFEKKYPKFTPIRYVYDDEKPYERPSSAIAKETTSESVIQINTEDGKIFLTINDFKVLRHLQKQVGRYIERCFDLYKEEFQAAEDNLNIKYHELWLEANPDRDSEDWLPVGVAKFDDKTIQEIDKFGIYTPAERKKYGLPLKGPIFREDNTDEYGNKIISKKQSDKKDDKDEEHITGPVQKEDCQATEKKEENKDGMRSGKDE